MTTVRVWARALSPGVLALCLLALVLFVLPVVMVLASAFRTGPVGAPGAWTTATVTAALADPATHRALRNSVILAGAAVALGTVLAMAFAWLSARTTSPLRRIVTPMMALLLAVPPLFYAVSWTMLGRQPAGALNQVFRLLTGSDAAPITLVSWPGLVLVLALKIASVSYLLIVGPFGAMDPSLEEAARVAGASRARALLTIELPALAPVLLSSVLLGAVVALGTLDLPLILGRPAGIPVLSTEVYVNARSPSGIPGSAAIGLLLLAIVLVLVLVLLLVERLVQRERHHPLADRSHQRERIRLGGWGWLSGAAIALFALISLGLPLGQLVMASLGTDSYAAVLADPQIRAAFGSTIVIGLVAGFVAAALAVTFSIAAQRSTSHLRRMPGASMWWVLAVPGVTLGLGILAAFLAIPPLRELHGSQVLNLVGLTVAATPIAGRATAGAVARVGRELEESARTSGASAARAIVGILVRLTLPGFAAGWLIATVAAAGNFDVPALLSSPGSPTVTVVALELFRAGSVAAAAAVMCLLLGLIAAVAAAGGIVLLVRPRGRRPAPVPAPRPARSSSSEPSEVAHV